ncbi:hypothetical protein HDU87_006306 [Geranomyces variabilis]|uniref:Proteasome activator subunit 4 n=1 Tax=Geranomyces variabilis TaxID=109894 RepID=A0AAD5XQN9_9FUNG|nr:hypothetical protein HDU87_006306 [Geranomyces variabilis]
MAEIPSPPAEPSWRVNLPYETDAEGVRWLAEIKQGLHVALAAANYQPGCVQWVKRLKYYLQLEYTLTTEDRAYFAEILYRVVCTPDIGPHVMGYFAVECTNLLRKKKDLPSSYMVLEWRPLFDAILLLTAPKDPSKISLSSSAVAGAMGALVLHAQRFFAPESTAEILQTLLPRMNVHENSWFSLNKGLLFMFLPTATPPAPQSGALSTPPFYWISTAFSLWALARTSMSDAALFLDVFARLAEDQSSSPSNDAWTDDQVRNIFSAGLSCFSLPVGTGSNGNPAGAQAGRTPALNGGGVADSYSQKAAIDPFAKFIVWAARPTEVDNANTNILLRLNELIHAVETYYHPSNAGRWSYGLARFLQMLSYHFLRRLRQEAKEGCKTPAGERLTPAMRAEFVSILRPVVYLALFGKDSTSVHCIHNCLKYLAWIDPALILPGLLERIYPALESLTESHRTISCIGALYHVALPLFNRQHYPPGGTHLAALLDLVIPGIDVNDPSKTLNTLMFIRHAFSCVPIIDLTRSPAPILVSDCRMEEDGEEERAAANEECRLGTAMFAGWVERFLERTFAVIENLPQEHGQIKAKRSTETSVILLIQYTLDLLSQQTSPEIEAIALRKVKNFVSENVIPNATKAVGVICAVTGMPERRLATFVPLCHDQIMSELQHGAAANPTTSSSFPFGFAAMSDARLHWYQCILLNVVQQSGAEALKWKKELLEVARASVKLCQSRRGWKWATKLIRILAVNASSVFCLEARSVGKKLWANQAWQEISHLYWGETPENRLLDIEWHVPNDAEKALVLEFVQEFVDLAMSELKKLMTELEVASEQKRDKREISRDAQKWLSLLRNCVRGMTTLIPPTAAKASDVAGGRDPLMPDFDRSPLMVGYCFPPGTAAHDQVQAVRTEITSFLASVSQTLRRHAEDDTACITILLRCCTELLSDRGCSRATVEGVARGYNQSRDVVSEGKNIANRHTPRYVLIIKMTVIHLARLEYNAVCDCRTPAGQMDLLLELEHWSVASYAVIRKEAQRGLSTVLKSSPDAIKQLVFWRAVAILRSRGRLPVSGDTSTSAQPTEVESDRLKGALYLLKTSPLLRIGMTAYDRARGVLNGLSVAYTSDKKSIKKRWGILAKEILGRYQELAVSTAALPDAIMVAQKLAADSLDQAVLARNSKLVTEQAGKSRGEHSLMVNDLMETLKRPDIPMSYRTVLIKFLDAILRDDAPVPVSVTQYLLTNVNSEEVGIRQMCLKVLRRVLSIIKRRAKEAHESKCPSKVYTRRSTWKPSSVEAYIASGLTDIRSEAEWRNAKFIDNSVGWYCWPEEHKVRQGAAASPPDTIPYDDPESRASIDLLCTTLAGREFWEHFFVYRMQEAPGHSINPTEAAAGIAPTERFEHGAAQFYALAAMVLGPRIVLAPLSAKVNTILALDADAVRVPEKAEQRAVVEVISGLLAGCKYWSWDDVNALWTWSGKVLARGLSIADTETFQLWPPALRYAFSQRDPRRHLPLIRQLIATTGPADNATLPGATPTQTFFAESKILSVARVLLTTYAWRLGPLAMSLVPTYLSQLAHPYLLVRQNIGANLSALISARWVVNAPSVQDVMAASASASVGPHAGVLALDDQGASMVKSVVDTIQRLRMDVIHDSANAGGAGTSTDRTAHLALEYKNAAGTVLAWFVNALLNQPAAAQHAYFPLLLPEVLHMQVWGDVELQQSAQLAARSYANYPHPAQMVPGTLKMVLEAATAKPEATASATSAQIRWQMRFRVLPLLQVFYFRHLFLLPAQTTADVTHHVASVILADPHVEVRALASTTLAGLVRCSSDPAAMILELKERFTATLAALAPLATRRGGGARATAASAASGPVTAQIEPTAEELAAKVAKKHAAVLGLAALVQAFPYDVPPWMPDVLVALAKCVGDSVPIGPSVSKTFADFRRTHQDNWQTHLTAFDEDQRELLADLLISPSYYA